MLLSVQTVARPTIADIQTRISTNAGGVEGNSDSYYAQFSPDGRYVAFESFASNLVASDFNNDYDIFLKDLTTGTIIRLSTDAGGAEADRGSFTACFTPDGHYVMFTSNASNLVEGDTNNSSDIFLKNLTTGAITRLSTNAAGAQANDSSYGAQFSPDGRYLVFHSTASNLVEGDTNFRSDIFLKDLTTGAITRLSTNAAGAQANASSYNAQFSPDGRYLVFESASSNLVEGDTNSSYDIFLKDLVTGAITRLSTSAAGAQADSSSDSARFSPDGRYVLFESSASNLVEGDTNNSSDIFLKDLVTDAVTCLSTDATGAQVNGSSSSARFSSDGRSVVFESDASNLVAGDTNGTSDIFLKDLTTGAITRLSTAAAGVEADRGSYNAQFSLDGRYVIFESGGSNLVAGDTNGRYDIFRVDLLYKAHAAAIAEGRFVEATLNVGNASRVSIAWGDGSSSLVSPTAGRATFNHAYASPGSKQAVVTLVEGALTWTVAHILDLGAGTLVRNTALADTLSGGAGSDALAGDAFRNILIGAAGADRLDGAAGDDRLLGGLGRDSLSGGAGKDVFVFAERDTGATKSKADLILDFSGKAGDRIDLSGIDANTRKKGDQKFVFIGSKAFSKAGELRVEKAKKETYIYLNTDNDKAAEAVIKLKGAIDLSKGWFVL
ncbi:PD40 domain-containing protein [Microvirga lotononidis]|uniref:Periplasmic component of the Tol biopolymer transport system n=1 Tax=Microvirga lotononidis TaxID=864069 RepID=I4YPM1_9HYPH|nr:PD40 domain-containing protein [Microvirga lotononidis]EIM25913.1 periplasmic component of the Tol biopolymer transport system [Microvirga lotononidis]WQO25827.1 PD40 domain-containing protein [Microvirga lotononidis]